MKIRTLLTVGLSFFCAIFVFAQKGRGLTVESSTSTDNQAHKITLEDLLAGGKTVYDPTSARLNVNDVNLDFGTMKETAYREMDTKVVSVEGTTSRNERVRLVVLNDQTCQYSAEGLFVKNDRNGTVSAYTTSGNLVASSSEGSTSQAMIFPCGGAGGFGFNWNSGFAPGGCFPPIPPCEGEPISIWELIGSW